MGLTSESVAFDLRVEDDPLATKPSSRASLFFFLSYFRSREGMGVELARKLDTVTCKKPQSFCCDLEREREMR